mmetsp:Transcript_9617/g.35243  ORF Transcript_9617/g.35243 Transcript_9617/m.35243 type:complete len:83 (+) Transcript_9617:1023-1271(+)
MGRPRVCRLVRPFTSSCRDVIFAGRPQGACVLAKSVRPERLKLNLDAVSLAMTPAQEQALDALHRDYRFGLGWLPGHFLPTT